jgi:predicted ATPase
MTVDVSTWGLLRDGRAPFVGRTAERAALEEALVASKNGEARVVTLVGPAGIGKSRLIQELILHHRAPGSRPADVEGDVGAGLTPRVYRGSARSTGAPFEVFAKVLRARFGLVEGMEQEAAKAQVRAQVAAVLDHAKVDDVAYFLGQLVGVPGDESPLTRAVEDDPQQAAILRRAVLKAFLEADAAMSATCLVFEDLHEAHDDSLALLRYLVE